MHEQVAFGPDLASIRRRADGEIAIETKGKPGGLAARGGARQLAVAQPLLETDRADVLRMGLGEEFDFVRALRGRLAATRQNFERGEKLKPRAAFGDEGVEVARRGEIAIGLRRLFEGGKMRGERLRLQGPDRRIIDSRVARPEPWPARGSRRRAGRAGR